MGCLSELMPQIDLTGRRCLHGQGSKKTITLPSGEVVCDLNGEWDAFVENYGPSASAGSYPQRLKITQTGSSFVAIRMIE